jgi:hypothetical protein
MKYFIEYADGDSKWMWFSKDIFLTVQYADYVKRFRYLEHLALSLDEAKHFKADFKNQVITSSNKIFRSLRSFSLLDL